MRLTAKRKRAFLEGIRRVINNETVSMRNIAASMASRSKNGWILPLL